MKLAARVALLIGTCATAALIVANGAPGIFNLLAQIEWRLPWLVPLHGIPLLLDVAGWRALLSRPVGMRTLFPIAAIREAVNRLLPVANIGGEIVGIRLMMRQGVPAPAATASIVVETLLTLVSQCAFAAMGLICLVHAAGLGAAASAALLGLGLSVPAIFAVAVLLRRGSLFHQAERLAARLLSGFSAGRVRFDGSAFDDAIGNLLSQPRRLLRAAIWQILGLLAGCAETWLVLRWLGHPIPIGAAIALESLTQAARSVFFVIPAGLGVQELGLLGLGRVLGVDAELAISLSLAKRLREILFGLPALGAWLCWPRRILVE